MNAQERLSKIIKALNELKEAISENHSQQKVDALQSVKDAVGNLEDFRDLLYDYNAKHGSRNAYTSKCIKWVDDACENGDYTALWYALAEPKFISELKRWVRAEEGHGEFEPFIKKGSSIWEFGFKNKTKAIKMYEGFKIISFLLDHCNEEFTLREIKTEMLKELKEFANFHDNSQQHEVYTEKDIGILQSAVCQLQVELGNETDINRREDLEDKIRKSQEIITKAKNLRGNSRKFDDSYRRNFVKNHQTAMKAIKAEHIELYNHLNSFLTVGEISSYGPDFEISWIIS